MSKIYTQIRQLEKQRESKSTVNIGYDEPVNSNRLIENSAIAKTKAFWAAVAILSVLFTALLISSLVLYGMNKQYSSEQKILITELVKMKSLLNKSTEQADKSTEATKNMSQALAAMDQKIKKINAGITDLQKKQAISAAALEQLKQTQDTATVKPAG